MIGRIQSRSAFLRLRREGRHVRSGMLSCTMIVDTSFQQTLVGYAFGRSFGSAVQRNRFRRRLRELVKARESAMSPGVYVFGGSPRAASLGFDDLGRHLDGLLAKCAEAAR